MEERFLCKVNRDTKPFFQSVYPFNFGAQFVFRMASYYNPKMNSLVSKISSLPRTFFALSNIKKLLVILIVVAVGWLAFGKLLKPQAKQQYTTAQVEKGTLVVSAAE